MMIMTTTLTTRMMRVPRRKASTPWSSRRSRVGPLRLGRKLEADKIEEATEELMAENATVVDEVATSGQIVEPPNTSMVGRRRN